MQAGPRKGFVFCLIWFSLFAARCNDTLIPKAAYFLVSSPTHGDSYVLPLTRAEDITMARAIIEDPESVTSRIVVARIAKGGGEGRYHNRDILGKREWSWHVTELVQFADATIELLDGTPTYVEEHLDEWISMTGGMIGFWSYTVTRELDPSQVES
ncbi:MAG: hypothetical protein HYX75_13325 [Acidobacteria bacterium]|nr:hypothetical protein [Acidobacteriota bacterium]